MNDPYYQPTSWMWNYPRNTVGNIVGRANEVVEENRARANQGIFGWFPGLGQFREQLWASPLGQRTLQGMRNAGLNPPGLQPPRLQSPSAQVGVGQALNSPIQPAPMGVGYNPSKYDMLERVGWSTAGRPIYSRESAKQWLGTLGATGRH